MDFPLAVRFGVSSRTDRLSARYLNSIPANKPFFREIFEKTKQNRENGVILVS